MGGASRHVALAGAKAALRLPAWIVGFSLLGVGSLARDAGQPIGAAMLSTVLIFAAPAQLILFSSLATGGLLAAAALAVAFSAIRLLPMTLALLPYLRRPGQPLVERCALAHTVAATTWIEGMRRLPDMQPEARIPYYTGFALACMLVSTVLTGIGYVLVGALPLPFAAGLLCLTPIYFTIAMVSGARRAGEWLAIAAGLGLAPLASLLVGRDFDILATGLVGGTGAFLVDRLARRRAAGRSGKPGA